MKKRSSYLKSVSFALPIIVSSLFYFAPKETIAWLEQPTRILQKFKSPTSEPHPPLPLNAVTTNGKATQIQLGTSPHGGALQLVLAAIESAHYSIEVASYSFTNKSIAQALIQKHRNGVNVRVVMDKSQNVEKYSSATFLANAGVPVRINSRYAIQHSKIMLIDNETIETGSFNFTQAAATRNSENVLVIWHHPALAKQYSQYWNQLWNEAQPYQAHLLHR